MPYGIVLLPDPELSQRFVEYSNEIAGQSALMSLDPTERPPHVTLLHVDASRQDAEKLWAQALGEVPQSLPVQLNGLKFAPMEKDGRYVDEACVFFGLEANNTSVLREVHFGVLELSSQLGISPIGFFGDNFTPHVTLGLVREVPTGVALPRQVVRASFVGRLVFGRLGPHGTFPEILDRAQGAGISSFD